MDIVEAFLNLTADIDIYIDIPPNQKINKEILKDILKWAYKLLKMLHSLKQTP